jgi:hypothetical protein
MRSFINEWLPPDFHQIRYLPLLLIWLALLWSLAGSRRPKARVLVPLLLTFLAAMDAVRHVPLLVLLAIPLIAAAGPDTLRWKPFSANREPDGRERLRYSFRVAVLLLLAGFTVVRWTQLARGQSRIETEQFPTQAMEFLRSRTTASRLFAYYDWGGYAIWKLYPRQRVFIDGRADLYGDDLLHQFQETAQLRPGWQQILDQWAVDAVLVPPAGALAQGLSLDQRWHKEYSDSQAILFLPATSSTHKVGNPPE